MNYYGQQYYQPRPMFRFPKLTPAVKTILIANVACFIVQFVFRLLRSSFIDRYFTFHPADFLRGRYVWQIVTSLFLHANLLHIIFNMFMLSFAGFGPALERFVGSRRFCVVYFLAGIGGNVLFLVAHLKSAALLLGASGAVFGVLAAYAMAFPERLVLLLFVYPVRVKWVILGLFAIELLSEVSLAGASGIAHAAHLGGCIFGWAYMKIVYKMSLPFAFIERLKWWVRRLFSGSTAPRNPFGRGASNGGHAASSRPHGPKARKYRPIDDGSFIDEEVDPILEKISKHGIGSLTPHERRILKRARQRMGKA